ncbi:Oligopeptide transport ATP-binding protein AppF [Nitrospina gracilis 3/211]|uniref:Oligopeptide transport ATP-binding protein AppF n=1 Tax=Nitrospina gracilis (strain 3/211) TaxID=1266370 RepID=M1YFY2_NITG3|nr:MULTISPECIES: oligopeptide/dipeptide ABC transporter ATP-binding protein [Nitrospina]MCF8722165.1 oligopeptide/dipeptide ABC transporter ATP-binding protein [Nitrospina sp. Nb-3]CCQ89358.1 Oligopeptide transport ATP-binding protein AppF [Nitrospina gracilis 3/211]
MHSSTPTNDAPLLVVENLKKVFRGGVRAVDGISFSIPENSTLGLVGESGCGKSTTGRAVLRLIDPTAGRIVFDGQDITTLSHTQMVPLRREMQVIFQDPYASLNPRMTVGRILEEPFRIHSGEQQSEHRDRVAELLCKVGLSPDDAKRYPHAFSGGQRQRIGIARAVALRPRFIVADEAVSALDVSIKAQILNLLQALQDEMSLSYLFISHDMGVVEMFCDRVAVMYLGRIVEMASAETLYASPSHPYTEALLDAIPKMDGNRPREKNKIVAGDAPNASNPPAGCAFHPRCPIMEKQCETEVPDLKEVEPGHWVACHLRS